MPIWFPFFDSFEYFLWAGDKPFRRPFDEGYSVFILVNTEIYFRDCKSILLN